MKGWVKTYDAAIRRTLGFVQEQRRLADLSYRRILRGARSRFRTTTGEAGGMTNPKPEPVVNEPPIEWVAVRCTSPACRGRVVGSIRFEEKSDD